MERRHFLLGSSALLAIPHTASAATLDFSKVPKKKTIDLRTDLSPEAWRMMVLMARDGEPGHAYIAALTYRNDIESFVSDSVFGLYPTEGAKWLLDEVPGQPDVLPTDARPDVALMIWTNPAQHNDVLELKDRYAAEGTYQLLLNDCVSMMADAAEILSLQRPSLTVRPYSYVAALYELN